MLKIPFFPEKELSKLVQKAIWIDKEERKYTFVLKSVLEAPFVSVVRIKFHRSLSYSANNPLVRIFVNVVELSNYSFSYR